MLVRSPSACVASCSSSRARSHARTALRRATPRANPHALKSYAGGMPGPMKPDDDADVGAFDAEDVRALRKRIAELESALETERTAKKMLEDQLRACVREVTKLLSQKRELEMEQKMRADDGK